jgi:hypothetical protein
MISVPSFLFNRTAEDFFRWLADFEIRKTYFDEEIKIT